MKPRSPTFQTVPLDVAGSLVYGRYSKISVENTYNMILSDGWLVDYAGYSIAVANINPGKGRAIYKSSLLNKLVIVIGSGCYFVTPNLTVSLFGTLNTSIGDVFIAEDNQGNIAICDKTAIFIWNPITGFKPAVTPPSTTSLDFVPGYVCFQDTRFISVDLSTAEWRLSDPLSPSLNHQFPNDAQHVGQFQTKPDHPIACVPFPGRSNFLLILGSIGGQLWVDTGSALFPYQLQTGVGIDFGTPSADTIDRLDDMICWLGINDRSGPVILVSNGGVPQRISNDGIDFKLNSLTTPQDSHGFMFKQDGHIFYQLTFPTDNFSITFDFTTMKFYTVTDPYLNYHFAKRVAYFNNTYYFVSVNDGNLYEMSTNDTTYAGRMIPRLRICKTFRMADTAPFICNNITFPLEQGVDGSYFNKAAYGPKYLTTENNEYITTEDGRFLNTEPNEVQFSPYNPPIPGSLGYTVPPMPTSIGYVNPPLPRVDLAVSYDGGETFSSFDGMKMNPIGFRKNRFIYYDLGWCNELTVMLRFCSMGRIVATNGTMSVYQ